MKIVLVSNFYNHHQAFISRKLFELSNGQFRFISTSELPNERKKLGYRSIVDPFLINYSDSSVEAQEWIDSADAVIIGAASSNLLKNRIANKKITMRYSEHLFKKGIQWWKFPYRLLRAIISRTDAKNVYLLCASAFAAPDYAKLGLFKSKSYKWGYFPECKKYDDFDAMMTKKDSREILWCGRFLDWKHPDDVIEVANRLKKTGEPFRLNIIGSGVMEDYLVQLVAKYGLENEVCFLGSTSPENVRRAMEHAGIYAFTSDHNEGWGVVLNEAMNSGCAIVASDQIGAAPYLLQDNENGLTYHSEDVDMLYSKIYYLLNCADEQRRLGVNAYNTIISKWNPDIAAVRLYALLQALVGGDENPNIFDEGPCSKA